MFLLLIPVFFASLAEACRPVYRAIDEFMVTPPREYYPALEANRSGHLKVSELHEIYWEESGNPNGEPVLFLHGGPGAGTNPNQRRFFDPKKYRIILMDQRGSGKSRPFGELRDNTLGELVHDAEKLRVMLGIERWHLFGGSSGSTVAIAYAEEFPERCRSLNLRGIFLGRRQDVAWIFSPDGPGRQFPDAWRELMSHVPASHAGDPLGYFAGAVSDPNFEVRHAAALAVVRWETTLATATMPATPILPDKVSETEITETRIELTYLQNTLFLEENQLLANAHRLRGIPGILIQGDHDYVTPPEGAIALQAAWPESRLVLVPGAGHPAPDPRLTDGLVRAADDLVDLP